MTDKADNETNSGNHVTGTFALTEGIWRVEKLRVTPTPDAVRLDPPEYLTPDWTPPTKYVHDWRRYISEPLEIAWQSFTPEQRLMLAENAQRIADNEEWD